jgi:hypothetical protein
MVETTGDNPDSTRSAGDMMDEEPTASGSDRTGAPGAPVPEADTTAAGPAAPPPAAPDVTAEAPPVADAAAPKAPPAPAHAASRRQQPPPVPQLVTELRELVVAYIKQQTIAPLQQLGRYVGFGIGGSLLLGFGVIFLALAGLRALQTETGTTFTGDWSWVPYLIMVFALVLGAALVWLFRTARRAEREAQ